MIGGGIVKITIEETAMVLERELNESVASFHNDGGRLDFFCRIR